MLAHCPGPGRGAPRRPARSLGRSGEQRAPPRAAAACRRRSARAHARGEKPGTRGARVCNHRITTRLRRSTCAPTTSLYTIKALTRSTCTHDSHTRAYRSRPSLPSLRHEGETTPHKPNELGCARLMPHEPARSGRCRRVALRLHHCARHAVDEIVSCERLRECEGSCGALQALHESASVHGATHAA